MSRQELYFFIPISLIFVSFYEYFFRTCKYIEMKNLIATSDKVNDSTMCESSLASPEMITVRVGTEHVSFNQI